jgi:hypothetical protein
LVDGATERCRTALAGAIDRAAAGFMSPHIDIMSPPNAMLACMTADWTEANDIISSANSAAANEVLLERLLAIVEEHTRPEMA